MIDQTTNPTDERSPIAGWISLPLAAARLGMHRDSVLKLMRAGQLVWIDLRLPGSRVPRYRLCPESVRRWPPPPDASGLPEPVQKVAQIPRRAGVIARRIEARRARRARLGIGSGRTA